ncbi:putative Mu-like prophage DNA circulation protein [uncultured Pleomorphomonas sp.]|uniref:Putative Mu-like prophage DNA circulation protein n=1 Tax=uncultured Pleomorphomonas sp. TaxID=442121 RepID=A0A212L771_9HYPH|nr:DNA circularization N-terminal domain-containing protein [uncultured Pleomorphomonas sp.]SCM73355.1 putative Mu-like prophage DNA circulation protein [uncultured Pleomorphomonas sp.]
MAFVNTFLPASFRGVPFRVADESGAGGRRIVVHNLVGGEAPITEDFGSKEQRYTVTAYVAGSLASVAGLALRAALKQSGAGLLVLPWQGPVQAHVEDFDPSRSKDVNGYIGFDITFVEAGSGSLFGSLPAISELSALMLTGISLVAGLVAAAITASGGAAADEIDAAADGVATLEALRTEAGITGDTADDLAARIEDLAVTDYADDPETWLTTAGDITRDLAREADTGMGANFRTYALAADVSTVTGTAMAGLLGAAAAMATAGADYACRQDAVAARAALADMADTAREAMASLGFDASEWYGGLIGAALDAMSRDAADLKPLVRVETGLSLPSTLVAWRLYGDPSRADELVARNKVATSCFMPAAMTAVAPD